MPKTIIILNKNCEIQLSQQKEAMMATAKELNLENISFFTELEDSYDELESEEVTILVEALDNIRNFYKNFSLTGRESLIIPSPHSRFISINENIDVNLVDYRVIELLESLKTTYKMLEEYN